MKIRKLSYQALVLLRHIWPDLSPETQRQFATSSLFVELAIFNGHRLKER